ncbi:hypothetical protein [Parabacteroides sp. FAFU027]|uniref:hypothetical protein n=1 Tax=Parabacteroides sp. FAFU027 TaxID=2922715 RepID=UPI001FAF848D|nr:hypothetical protein [Parabacteroides sp. FAFU027]
MTKEQPKLKKRLFNFVTKLTEWASLLFKQMKLVSKLFIQLLAQLRYRLMNRKRQITFDVLLYEVNKFRNHQTNIDYYTVVNEAKRSDI